jgi:hypothetical protein
LSIVSFLGREDIRDQVIPVEKLTRAKDVWNIKNRGLHAISQSQGGRGRHRRGRGSRRGWVSLLDLSPLRGWGRGQGKTMSRRHTEMMVVRKQEAMKEAVQITINLSQITQITLASSFRERERGGL